MIDPKRVCRKRARVAEAMITGQSVRYGERAVL
jgi:hypothetical protein